MLGGVLTPVRGTVRCPWHKLGEISAVLRPRHLFAQHPYVGFFFKFSCIFDSIDSMVFTVRGLV